MLQQCCGAQERCVWVCLHQPDTPATSARPPRPPAVGCQDRYADSGALAFCGKVTPNHYSCGRAVVQEYCRAQDKCIWVCLHQPDTPATSARPPRPPAVRCQDRYADSGALVFCGKVNTKSLLVWPCGGAGVLQSSGQVYLGMPAHQRAAAVQPGVVDCNFLTILASS